MNNELAEVWAVEVLDGKTNWLPVQVFIDKPEAEKTRIEWVQAAGFDSWRVRRYVPDGEVKS